MAEKLVSPGALDKLAKLLATENIAVEHAPVVTASFDVKNRVLRLPMWQEMTESLYHLLVLHEVGHALETPCDGWKGAIDAVEESDGRRVSRTFQGYLNVVEDARIERKIKAKFPGSRRDFHDGYKWLFESDFFNVKSTKPDELSTIDRINLYFKVGSHMQVPFSDAEQVFVKRAEDIHTWDEAVQLATDLLAFAKEKAEQEEEDMDEEKRDVSTRTLDDDDGEEGDDWEDAEELGDEGKSKSGDGDETEDDGYKSKGRKQSNGMIEEATTDKALSDKMQDLVDPAMLGRELRYVVLPKDIDSSNFIVKCGDILKFAQHDINLGKAADYQAFANRVFSKFRSDNNNAINYMVKEFEMKKAATAYSRSKQSKTGTIDTTKIHSYKFSEDIFRRLTVLPTGKNHGLVVYLDLSGSMCGHIRGAVEQMITLATFCRRANIPHRIYGFSTGLAGAGYGHPATLKYHDMRTKINTECRNIGHRVGKHFVYPNAELSLLELFHEGMNLRDFNFMCSTLLISGMIQNYTNCELIPTGYSNVKHYVRDAFFDKKRDVFEFLSLGSTPFNDSLMLGRDIITKFTKEKNLEIVNMVTITDGESDHPTYVMHSQNGQRGNLAGSSIIHNNRTSFLTDEHSKRQIRLNFEYNHQYTSMYAKLIRDTMKVNLVGFYITNSARDVTNGATTAGANWYDADLMAKSFRSNQYAIVPGLYGHNEFYYIKGGKDLRTENTGMGDIGADASKGKLKTAFVNAQSKRGTSRVVLSKFVEKIAV
jgi:hypothetical protein